MAEGHLSKVKGRARNFLLDARTRNVYVLRPLRSRDQTSGPCQGEDACNSSIAVMYSRGDRGESVGKELPQACSSELHIKHAHAER